VLFPQVSPMHSTHETRVVVTGGAGYLGSVVTAHLLLAGYSVVVLDRLAGGGESLLGFAGHERFRLVVGDVRDSLVLTDALKDVSAVIHLAAVVGEPACAVDEAEARSINLGGATSVLAAAEAFGVERLVMVSTCSNYGVSDPDVLADEDAPLRPLGVYARSKVDAELAVLGHRGATTVRVLRLGTICGLSPRMRFDLLVNEMARAAVLGDGIRIFAPDAWRPFLHIRDAARVVERSLAVPAEATGGRVFNVVGENYQKKGLANLARHRFPSAPVELTDAVPDARDYRASGARILREWGFEPVSRVEDAFLEIAAAVRSGVFRDPRWDGYAAAPIR